MQKVKTKTANYNIKKFENLWKSGEISLESFFFFNGDKAH